MSRAFYLDFLEIQKQILILSSVLDFLETLNHSLPSFHKTSKKYFLSTKWIAISIRRCKSSTTQRNPYVKILASFQYKIHMYYEFKFCCTLSLLWNDFSAKHNNNCFYNKNVLRICVLRSTTSYNMKCLPDRHIMEYTSERYCENIAKKWATEDEGM